MTKSNSIDAQIYTDLKSLRLMKYKATGFDFLPPQPVNSLLTGRHVSKLRGRGLNFEEMRHYHIGDDIRTMDWKVTMRTGKPHVKIFSEERERNVYLLVDQRTNMFFGSTGKMKSVVAAEIAALIAWKVTDSTDRVGAIIYNDTVAVPIAPQRSANHVLKILNEIVIKNQQLKVGIAEDSQGNSFSKLFHQAKRLVKHDALVILITDGYGYNEQSEEQIKTLCKHNDVVLCHVTDPLEHNLAELDKMVLSDGEMQLAITGKQAQLKDCFAKDVTDTLDNFARVAKKYRIPVIKINTVQPVDQQLRKALGA
ncbi:MoxR protein [Vibrio breoganii]|uniref:DUF58 domain-containing protein n=1 Tax=Vibrio breoganii TaxID=553239 RepID=A0ABX1UDD9_9VIBR|nr:DUF58 domain-containing protein [Vibrio breoganii]NMO74887.1 DUF58 domain-containing protein [Vibrio breoganii]NMR71389.1 DUF58 domain-containing protein [Vibrio breoganii]PMG01509.1 MoxR protein [Vibrio breoganii]PML88260.1 MoxR protein [Vibrio breoganii]